jgi:hypothetical protein
MLRVLCPIGTATPLPVGLREPALSPSHKAAWYPSFDTMDEGADVAVVRQCWGTGGPHATAQDGDIDVSRQANDVHATISRQANASFRKLTQRMKKHRAVRSHSSMVFPEDVLGLG